MAQLKSTIITGDLTVTDNINGISLNTQPINTILAGPSSGSNGAPTFRSLTAADLPTVVSVVNTDVVYSNWSGSGPYTINISVTGMTTNANAIIGLSPTATVEAYDAAAKAKLLVTAQSSNTITITAYGIKPTITIPITIMMIK